MYLGCIACRYNRELGAHLTKLNEEKEVKEEAAKAAILAAPADFPIPLLQPSLPPAAAEAGGPGGAPPSLEVAVDVLDKLLATGIDLKKLRKRLAEHYTSEAYLCVVDVWRKESPRCGGAGRRVGAALLYAPDLVCAHVWRAHLSPITLPVCVWPGCLTLCVP